MMIHIIRGSKFQFFYFDLKNGFMVVGQMNILNCNNKIKKKNCKIYALEVRLVSARNIWIQKKTIEDPFLVSINFNKDIFSEHNIGFILKSQLIYWQWFWRRCEQK